MQIIMTNMKLYLLHSCTTVALTANPGNTNDLNMKTPEANQQIQEACTHKLHPSLWNSNCDTHRPKTRAIHKSSQNPASNSHRSHLVSPHLQKISWAVHSKLLTTKCAIRIPGIKKPPTPIIWEVIRFSFLAFETDTSQGCH